MTVDVELISWLKEKIAEEEALVGNYERRRKEIDNHLREAREMISHFEKWLADELQQGIRDDNQTA